MVSHQETRLELGPTFLKTIVTENKIKGKQLRERVDTSLEFPRHNAGSHGITLIGQIFLSPNMLEISYNYYCMVSL